MKNIKFILVAAAVAMMVAFAGCRKCGGGSPDDQKNKNENTSTDDPANGDGGTSTDDQTTGNQSSKTFTVTFVSDGGSEVAPQTVTEGELATEPTAPTRTDYIFAGWFTDDGDFADQWDFAASTVTADITLYAKWTAVGVTPDVGAEVSINGVIWAECNVDAPGTFTATPEATGMFYQWNRKKAWPATGSVTDWDATYPSGDTWEATNDPCPAGWCVPTYDEQATLLNTADVSNEWTTLNGVNGLRFTDKTSGASIFLPAAGDRFFSDGGFMNAGGNGFYWSSSQLSSSLAWYLNLRSNLVGQNSLVRAFGLSVRCVRQS